MSRKNSVIYLESETGDCIAPRFNRANCWPASFKKSRGLSFSERYEASLALFCRQN